MAGEIKVEQGAGGWVRVCTAIQDKGGRNLREGKEHALSKGRRDNQREQAENDQHFIYPWKTIKTEARKGSWTFKLWWI